MNDFVVVIPSRYASERLPGKPLLALNGKAMIQHAYERGTESGASEVIIATDDERIAEVSEAFGATVCMTRDDHQSGKRQHHRSQKKMTKKTRKKILNEKKKMKN